MTLQKIELSQSVSRTNSPLYGRTILVTRTVEGNYLQKRQLETLGANVVELATIRISPPSSWVECDRAIAIADDFDWIVFTSANGVRAFFRRCNLRKGAREFLEKLKNAELSKPKFACVGPSTKQALEREGFRSSFEPSEFLTISLATELTDFVNLTGKKVLLARVEGANNEISNVLEASGAKVFEAPVYATHLRSRKISKATLESLTDITLTSPSTVEGLFRSISSMEIKARGMLVHCIGPVTAKRAKQYGLDVHSIAKTHTIDGLVESILDFRAS